MAFADNSMAKNAEEESRKKFLAYKNEVSRMADKVQKLQAGI